MMQSHNAETDLYNESPDARIFQNNQIISDARNNRLEQKSINAFDSISWRTRLLHHSDRHKLVASQDWIELMLKDVPLLREAGWKVCGPQQRRFIECRRPGVGLQAVDACGGMLANAQERLTDAACPSLLGTQDPGACHVGRIGVVARKDGREGLL